MPSSRAARFATFRVEGQEFQLPKPFLAIHSPLWAAKFQEEPEREIWELDGEAAGYRGFVAFLKGDDGGEGEVTEANVLSILHWANEFKIDYAFSICENFLLNSPPKSFDPVHLLELAARYDLPLLYSRMTEVVAQDLQHHDVPVGPGRSPIFDSAGIREDLVTSHVTMGSMRNDGELRKRHRFADHTALSGHQQRARLMWKSRPRFVPPPAEPPQVDWRISPSTVWPHDSLRDETWPTVPNEGQVLPY